MSFKFEIPEDITLDEKTLEKYKGKTLDEINDILKEEKELKRKELKKKQSERKISINYFETWSLHNINNITFLTPTNDLTFLVTNDNMDELSEFGLIQNIENKFKKYYKWGNDYVVSIFKCKLSDGFINTFVNCPYYPLSNDSISHADYELRKEDKEILQRFNITKDSFILGIRVEKCIYRKEKSLLWKIKNKRKCIIYDFTNKEE